METGVLIVGAGPTGLVLAIELARRGVPITLVDKADRYFGGSRADGIQPRTLEVFDDLGIARTVLAEGDGGSVVRAYQGDQVVWEGRQAEPVPPRPDVPYPNIWLLPQYRTEELLREVLAGLGHRVELRHELLDLAQDVDGVTATVAGPDGATTIRAGYVVGTDGGRSTVRRLLGIPFDGETDEDVRTAFGDVRVAGLDREYGRIFDNGESRVGLMPLSGTDLFTVTATAPESGVPTLAYLQEQVTAATGDDRIRLLELTWATVWRANARLARRYRSGRVLLAGDAAHVCPPTGGQGMNTGIGDAYNLGWKLASVLAGTPDALLDSYEAERRPTGQAALDLAATLLDRHKRGDDDAHRRGSEVHQLGVHYRFGPLADDRRPRPGPVAAGDRAPDSPLADGTLFDLFRGPHWTLLAFDTDAPDVPDVPAHVIPDRQARESYQVEPGTLVLVRPDGYIGLVTTDPADVPDYLARVRPAATTTH